MYTAIIKNSKGESLNLSQNPNIKTLSIDGLTPPKATLNFSVIPTKDGSVFNSARAENRNIVFSLAPIYDIEKSRLTIYKFFRVKQPVYFYFANGSRNVCIEGIVESVEGSLFERNQNLQISIICPEPYFKALEETVSDLSQVTPLFSFPFAIAEAGVVFSEIEKTIEKNIYYAGEVETGFTIEMRALAAVTDPRIYNEAGESFSIGLEMQAGDVLTINTVKGSKTVTLLRDGVKSNIINLVKPNPKWFTLIPGDNVFLYSASHPDLLQVSFRHYALYEGV